MARETNRDKTAASAKASWRPFEADHSPVRSDVFYKERDAGAASPALEARRRPLAPSGRALSLRAHPGDGRGRGDRAVRRDRGGPLRDRHPVRAVVAVPWRRSCLVFVRNRARGLARSFRASLGAVRWHLEFAAMAALVLAAAAALRAVAGKRLPLFEIHRLRAVAVAAALGFAL